jgi:hypothetical protein
VPEIKERSILFSAEMVRAILDGRKTQTRRVFKNAPDDLRSGRYPIWPEHEGLPPSRYGQPGDRLWVRETYTWITLAENEFTGDGWPGRRIRKPDGIPVLMLYRSDAIAEDWDNQISHWNPSIFMPRWASRITLEIISVRVERVQSISIDDIKAEGCTGAPLPGQVVSRNDGYQHYQEFKYLWDSINAKRGYGWDANPWVWVIEFTAANGETR